MNASKTIVLSTYDTFASRTLTTHGEAHSEQTSSSKKGLLRQIILLASTNHRGSTKQREVFGNNFAVHLIAGIYNTVSTFLYIT